MAQAQAGRFLQRKQSIVQRLPKLFHTSAMLPPKAMKAMKGAKKGLTATAVYKSVADEKELKTKDVKAIVAAYMGIASTEVKKQGSFKVAGMLKMKLKVKAATKARKGINPFTKEPCVFKAKPASKTVKCFAMRKLKDALN